MRRSRPEILAPVADREMCRAAVHNGADAVYFGMPGFNARGRAPTLSMDDISEMMSFCRLYGVKVFVACNVLAFESELNDLAEILCELLRMGPDALIVQDIGLVRLINYLAPHQKIHASTQMTVTNAETIDLLKDLSISRFILGREVPIPEISKIRNATDRELEVFVHGALCVSYSGQCLTSEVQGNRSANRGQCAQSCRLPYDLVVDGVEKDLGGRHYLVSPKDLAGLREVKELIDAGVQSFKIEGRLKSPEYVASTVSSYRAAAEAAAGEGEPIPDERLDELAAIYSRGFFPGWLHGVDHQSLVGGWYGTNRGLRLGTVRSVGKSRVTISTDHGVEKGDGVLFVDRAKGAEVGGPVYGVETEDGVLHLSFANAFRVHEITLGMEVFKTSSPQIEKKWRRTFTDKHLFKQIPVCMRVTGRMGTPLTLEVEDDAAHTVIRSTRELLQPARTREVTEEYLRERLGALSGTGFVLKSLISSVEKDLFIDDRAVKELKREAAAELAALRRTPYPRPVVGSEEARAWILKQATMRSSGNVEPKLNVLLRELEQITALKGLPIDTVYLDFEFGKEYGPAVEEVRALGFKAGIAATRILKPGELGHLKVIERVRPDVVLARNLGAIQFLSGKELTLIADFSLNISNSLSAGWLLGKGISRFTPSYDLNGDQLLALLASADPSCAEVTVHQYMPAFHMEHCVFAAFLSKGSSFRDCGKPCERHRVALKAPNGVVHPLKADAECRNTMFNGTPQSAARLIPSLLKRGVRHFRLEALYEDRTALRDKITAYHEAIRGAAPEEIFRRLGVHEQYGVNEGQLFNIKIHRDRKRAGNDRSV